MATPTPDVTRTLRRRTALLIAALAAIVLVAAACSDDGDDDGNAEPPVATQPDASADQGDTEPGDPAGGATVEAVGFLFQPGTLEVEVGTEVIWSNGDDVAHTATAEDGEFDIELAGSGATGTHTFDEPGTYTYTCLIHASMTGTVEVG